MKSVTCCRIVLLTFDHRPPVQVRVDDSERYDRLRAELNNYQEHEAAEPNAAIPLMSIEEMEKAFGIKTPCRQSWFRMRAARNDVS